MLSAAVALVMLVPFPTVGSAAPYRQTEPIYFQSMDLCQAAGAKLAAAYGAGSGAKPVCLSLTGAAVTDPAPRPAR